MPHPLRYLASRLRNARQLGWRAYLRLIRERGPWRLIAYLGKLAPWAAPGLGWCAHVLWPRMGRPFNAQCARETLVRELMAQYRPAHIVETGTFRGATTEAFASMPGVTVWSCEVMAAYHWYCRRRLCHLANTHLLLGDSRTLLRQLAARSEITAAPCLFYLDAHWYSDLPLPEEIEIIRTHWRSAVIVVDDFQVPGDAGYLYDDYGPGARLTLDWLDPRVLDGYDVYFPRCPSAWESGAQRGCMTLAWGEARGAARRCSLLTQFALGAQLGSRERRRNVVGAT